VSADTGEQLRAALWERPTDRALLAVYADWLAQAGETSRAEYIHLSLLERRSPAQERRREALRKRDRGTWLGPARRFVWTWQESDESPGFVAQVQCSMPKLVAGFELVRALGPRLVVSVSAPKARREVEALATLPLGTLYGLALYENDAQWVNDDLLVAIAPRIAGLRKLVLHAEEARASLRGWRAVLDRLDGIEELDLSLGDPPEAWIAALLESSSTRSLRRLSVPGWLDRAIRERLVATLPACAIELRDEQRLRFDREAGYYVRD